MERCPGMEYIAVLDTETNWNNQVMSIGVVLADGDTYCPAEARYYIVTPECEIGGMYDGVLELAPREKTRCTGRKQAMQALGCWLESRGVRRIFAYNARFDCRLLPELSRFSWFDIMRLAAYRQYNGRIGEDCPCCRTGRLKSRYGVEPILQLLSGRQDYRETHNAYYDALDELEIMKLLGRSLEDYACAAI